MNAMKKDLMSSIWMLNEKLQSFRMQMTGVAPENQPFSGFFVQCIYVDTMSAKQEDKATSKSKEELTALKKEIEAYNEKCRELTPED